MTQPNIAYLDLESLASLYAENRHDRDMARRSWRDSGDKYLDRHNRRKETLCGLLEEFESNLLHAKQAYDIGDLRMSAVAVNEAIRNLRLVVTDENGAQSIIEPYSPLDIQWMFYQPIQYTKLLNTVRTTHAVPPSLRWLFAMPSTGAGMRNC